MQVIAIDGGGTQCRVAYVTAERFESVVSGTANASNDFETTLQSIESGLAKLAIKLDIPLSSLTALPAYIGVAGVVNSDIASKLKLRLPFKQAKVEDDRRCALRGALEKNDGFVLHCGTGSFFATQKMGNTFFAGGWGPVLDDIGSGYWVGVRAMRACLYAQDGLLPQSDLTEYLMMTFNGDANMVSYAATASTAQVGTIAKDVVRYAEHGDRVAINVMRQGASQLEEKLQQLGWQENLAVCLTGGLGEHYEPYLSNAVQQSLIDALGTPLDGAVNLAREYHKELHR